MPRLHPRQKLDNLLYPSVSSWVQNKLSESRNWGPYNFDHLILALKHSANQLMMLKLASQNSLKDWLLIQTKSFVDADSQAY
jgi:hypothetical protein